MENSHTYDNKPTISFSGNIKHLDDGSENFDGIDENNKNSGI